MTDDRQNENTEAESTNVVDSLGNLIVDAAKGYFWVAVVCFMVMIMVMDGITWGQAALIAIAWPWTVLPTVLLAIVMFLASN